MLISPAVDALASLLRRNAISSSPFITRSSDREGPPAPLKAGAIAREYRRFQGEPPRNMCSATSGCTPLHNLLTHFVGGRQSAPSSSLQLLGSIESTSGWGRSTTWYWGSISTGDAALLVLLEPHARDANKSEAQPM